MRYALTTSERLIECKIKFYRINQTANYEHFLTITLTDTIVSDVTIDPPPKRRRINRKAWDQ
ncbi:type VI secretion system tube protein Hcp [Endozoicomonas numazuensis]|uniref:type VI secretion system tube protein Hcp n=1 Tax=Endozoicomonas numazuensis TaxID=1137799 RepID=UPI0009DE7A60|nr:type VI secretion system tube protein Hcp [Endozoicomonas numazuensis]